MLLSASVKRFFVSRLRDFYDPDWEVDHKVELEVNIKETDDMGHKGPIWTNTVALSTVQKSIVYSSPP